jgi:mRNA interferase MazF
VQRGDVWWADLPAPAGSEPEHRRPMLIVQSDAFNRSAIGTVLCAVITSNLRLAGAPGNVRIAPRESGLPKPSVVNVSQLVTLDRTSLTERVQTLSIRTMEQIDEGLRLVTGL